MAAVALCLLSQQTSVVPSPLSETPNGMSWNTQFYSLQLESQFLPGPTDGDTELNITWSLVRGRLRQAPTKVDPSSAMTQQPLRNCTVAYSRKNLSLFVQQCKAEKTSLGAHLVETFWSLDTAHHDGRSQARYGGRCFQNVTWKYKVVVKNTN